MPSPKLGVTAVASICLQSLLLFCCFQKEAIKSEKKRSNDLEKQLAVSNKNVSNLEARLEAEASLSPTTVIALIFIHVQFL